jgi:hypothetical protein
MELARAPGMVFLAVSGHPNPYPPSRGQDPPEHHRPGYDVVWKRVVSAVGLAGFVVLLLVPSLRDPLAWAMVAGAAGVFPLDRFLERRGVG